MADVAAAAGAAAYQPHIGLEIHVQLITASKVFCQCRNAFGDRANENVCPVCLGYPGILPALNREAVLKAYVIARTLGCTLSRRTVFERKNYFYPDLPKNYQISQFGAPIGRAGAFTAEIDGSRAPLGIREVHLEEDAGKMIHAGDISLLDYNRTGTPLVEVVTQPELGSATAAEQFLEEFRRMVRFLGVCDGNMEQGSLRCDANVSVNRVGAGLGSKVEIKNLNSFKFVRNALAFEIKRQTAVLAEGAAVRVETRLWNENRDCTEPMRVKESEDDYRYFPEPDLPPFCPDDSFFAAVEECLVELPLARRDRLAEQYALPAQQAAFLTAEPETADFFEQTVAAGGDASLAARWLGADIRKHLNRRRETFAASHLSPERLAALLELLAAGTVNGKIAKQVLATVIEQDRDPQAILAQEGLRQVTDAAELQPVLGRVLAENPRVGEQIAAGDRKPVGFLVGQVMRHTAGRAHPDQVHGLIEALYAQQAAPEEQE
jgi:aspartyl-tRNA(Asn)/glutamyl-tRNA(Gln) amidotransferase subunit B